jgi:hypothetical protein
MNPLEIYCSGTNYFNFVAVDFVESRDVVIKILIIYIHIYGSTVFVLGFYLFVYLSTEII